MPALALPTVQEEVLVMLHPGCAETSEEGSETNNARSPLHRVFIVLHL